ncbi:site-specific integrase [Streptococcus oriscaviae]|uniref:Site-specific integrase n=1 Tax=Streptococcus oriscaviae TaxID=2781599 RepID=A0ABX7YIH5_9STRE|nr:site-specific integrase [Streptococcus oriscaviae]QUE53545.1 site-specific integrase [Streptococcus oriscaviae]
MSISYRKRGKHKLWDYRVFDKKGCVIAFDSGFKTKREAMYNAVEIERKLLLTNVFTPKATLYELWLKWHELIIVPSKLAKSSKDKHIQRGKVIKENFGDMPVTEITHSQYQKFINDYCSRVLVDQVRRFNKVVQSVLVMAQRDGALLTNFTEEIVFEGETSRKKAADKHIRSMEEYERLLIELKKRISESDSVTPVLLYLYFTTGFRPGEGAGLCWPDIDFEKMVIKTYRRYSGDSNSFYPSKNKWSERVVPMSAELATILKLLQHKQERILSEKGVTNPEKLVFFDWLYGVPTSTAISKYLNKVLAGMGCDYKLTAYSGRHSYGSYLLAKKVDIWVVAKILGHKDIQQLMETYGHLLQEIEKEGFQEIRELLVIQR